MESTASQYPPIVTTRQELDALPVGAVVLETGEHPSAYQSGGRHEWAGDGRWYESGQIPLPATVLYTPSGSGDRVDDWEYDRETASWLRPGEETTGADRGTERGDTK